MGSKYTYSGPVTSFGRFIGTFEGETFAESAKKARNNLVYQFKKKYGMGPGMRVELSGNVKEEA